MQIKTAIRFRGFRPTKGVLTDDLLARDFQPSVFMRMPDAKEMAMAGMAGAGAGGLGTLGYAEATGLLDHLTRVPEDVERIQQMERDGTPQDDVEAAWRSLQGGVGHTKTQAHTPSHVAATIVKRLRRRKGDDKYHDVNYASDPGKPDASHDGKYTHEKAADHLTKAAARAYQIANGTRLANEFLNAVA